MTIQILLSENELKIITSCLVRNFLTWDRLENQVAVVKIHLLFNAKKEL